jgi:hypothetical protein
MAIEASMDYQTRKRDIPDLQLSSDRSAGTIQT